MFERRNCNLSRKDWFVFWAGKLYLARGASITLNSLRHLAHLISSWRLNIGIDGTKILGQASLLLIRCRTRLPALTFGATTKPMFWVSMRWASHLGRCNTSTQVAIKAGFQTEPFGRDVSVGVQSKSASMTLWLRSSRSGMDRGEWEWKHPNGSYVVTRGDAPDWPRRTTPSRWIRNAPEHEGLPSGSRVAIALLAYLRRSFLLVIRNCWGFWSRWC
jgi:hypothetical protein